MLIDSMANIGSANDSQNDYYSVSVNSEDLKISRLTTMRRC
jgi:hypothetical protein